MRNCFIDLPASTATHSSGLVILFEPAEDAAGAWDGRIISAISEGLPLDAQALAEDALGGGISHAPGRA